MCTMIVGYFSREQCTLSLERGEKMVTVALKEYGVKGRRFLKLEFKDA